MQTKSQMESVTEKSSMEMPFNASSESPEQFDGESVDFKALFSEFEELDMSGADEEADALAQRICAELSRH